MRALRLLCVTLPIAVITALVNLPTKGFWSWVIAIVIATGVIAITDSGRRWPWRSKATPAPAHGAKEGR